MKKGKDIEFQNVTQNEEESDKSPVVKHASSLILLYAQKYGKLIKLSLFLLILMLIMYGIFKVVVKLDEQKRKDAEIKWKETATIESVCSSTKWREGVYLNCTNLDRNSTTKIMRNMGISNMRNTIVTCLRLAIDSGTGLILPRVAIRSDNNLTNFDNWTDLSFLFDFDNFKEQLGQSCPQLKLYDSFYPVDNTIVVERTLADDFYHPGKYYNFIDNLLSAKNVNKPVVVWEKEILFGWDFRKDAIKVHKELIDIVQFPSKVRMISRALAESITVKYFGLHLRAEADAPWEDYKHQLEWFLKTIHKYYPGINTVYVAVGSQEIAAKFTLDVAKYNLRVISKWTKMAENNDLAAQIKDLHFDQLAIIDYDVLVRSNYFFGLALSSYAFSIAFDRSKGDASISNCKCHLLGRKETLFECCF